MAHYVKKNGVLTPLNGRSAQDYLDAKGRIVVDISTQQVGDVIRVRSLLDPTQVWNKEITELGDYMVFDVPCKDIYAICLVQDVEGTPTEFNNKNKAVDYGQIVLTDVLPENPVDLKQIYKLGSWTHTEASYSGPSINVSGENIYTSVNLQPSASGYYIWMPAWYNTRRFKKATVSFSRENQTITSGGNTGTSYTKLVFFANNSTASAFHQITEDVIDHEVSLEYVDDLLIVIHSYSSGNYGGWPLTKGWVKKLILS